MHLLGEGVWRRGFIGRWGCNLWERKEGGFSAVRVNYFTYLRAYISSSCTVLAWTGLGGGRGVVLARPLQINTQTAA